MKTQNEVLLRPLISYAGNKFEVAQRFQHLFNIDPTRRYVAPFCGGLGDAHGIRPRKAFLSDYCAPLINLYQTIQGGTFEFTLHGKGTKDYYDLLRDEFNAISFGGTTDIERAMSFLTTTLERLGANEGKNKKKCAELIAMYQAFIRKERSLTKEQSYRQNIRWAELTYYILASGYNGLLRTNLSGLVNIPCGRPWKVGAERTYIKDISPYQKAFQHWEFKSLSFEEVQIERNDFVYLDPPYAADPNAQKKPHTYSAPFNWNDQMRLADWAKRLQVPVVASNAATPGIIELWCDAGFQVLEKFSKKRIIGPNKEDRILADEVLFYKP
jgi:site-specific DNA-adenine methylase